MWLTPRYEKMQSVMAGLRRCHRAFEKVSCIPFKRRFMPFNANGHENKIKRA